MQVGSFDIAGLRWQWYLHNLRSDIATWNLGRCTLSCRQPRSQVRWDAVKNAGSGRDLSFLQCRRHRGFGARDRSLHAYLGIDVCSPLSDWKKQSLRSCKNEIKKTLSEIVTLDWHCLKELGACLLCSGSWWSQRFPPKRGLNRCSIDGCELHRQFMFSTPHISSTPTTTERCHERRQLFFSEN